MAFNYHPALDMYDYASNGFVPNISGVEAIIPERHFTGVLDVNENTNDIDDTPKIVAAIGLAALITLIMLKRAGFRFSFGATVGK